MELLEGFRSLPRPFYYHVLKFKRSEVVRIHVNGFGFIGTSKYFWETRGEPTIVINGDEGHYEKSPVLPKGLGISDGRVYKYKSEETCIQWNEKHKLIGISDKILPGAWNACGGSNRLLNNGVVPDWLDNKPSIDPRTSLFWNDEYYFIIMIDGRNNGTLGLTLKELGEFALSLGAVDGHNLDGGDSCQLLINGEIKNNLPDGRMHAVVNHIGFWLDESTSTPEAPPTEPTTGENIMTAWKVIKTVRKRPLPSFYSDNVSSDKDAVAGLEFESQATQATAEVISGTKYNVIWEQLPGGYWVPRNHYNSGEIYLEEIAVVPPSADNPVVLITATYQDGTTQEFVPRV